MGIFTRITADPQQARGRQLNEQLAGSQSAARPVEVMLVQVAGNEHLIEALGEQLAQAAAQAEVLSTQSHTLEAALVAAQAMLASQQEIIAELHGRYSKLD